MTMILLASSTELTNVLLGAITVLLGIIGFFLANFYYEVRKMGDEFHNAMKVQASHEARITNLEERSHN